MFIDSGDTDRMRAPIQVGHIFACGERKNTAKERREIEHGASTVGRGRRKVLHGWGGGGIGVGWDGVGVK